MERRVSLIIVAIIVLLLAGAIYAWSRNPERTEIITPSPTSSPTGETTSTEPQTLTLRGGELVLTYPNTYGLAISDEQVLVHSYIPPCDQGFDYCFYYNGKEFENTNFESAGLRIKIRSDLKNERSCLNTAPPGFSSATKPNATTSQDRYSASVFQNVGGGAAGHIAEGSLFRLFIRKSSNCYEFETRIGTSQFANYPSGTIKEFTDAQKSTVRNSLFQTLRTIKITGGDTPVAFPGI